MAKTQMRNRPVCSTALVEGHHHPRSPKIRNFTTKSLPLNLKISNRTQTPILSLQGANATLQSPSYNFTTKSLPQNLKMSNRTQICDANVIPPTISIPNHYRKTQIWGIEPKSSPLSCHCEERKRRSNLHRSPLKKYFKTQSRPIFKMTQSTTYHTLNTAYLNQHTNTNPCPTGPHLTAKHLILLHSTPPPHLLVP